VLHCILQLIPQKYNLPYTIVNNTSVQLLEASDAIPDLINHTWILFHASKNFIIHLAPNGLTIAKDKSTGCTVEPSPFFEILAAYQS